MSEQLVIWLDLDVALSLYKTIKALSSLELCCYVRANPQPVTVAAYLKTTRKWLAG